MELSRIAALLALTFTAGACSRFEKARPETSEETDEGARADTKKSKRSPSSKKLVFDDAPPRSATPRLTFDAPAPGPPKVEVAAHNDFFLGAVHRIAPQLRTLETAPRIKQISIRRERVDAELIAPSGDSVRSIDLVGDALLAHDPKQDLILKTSRDLAERAFALEDVDWAKIPMLVKDAETRVKDGEGADFVSIKRSLPFSKDVQIRVFVKPRSFADYTAKGVFIRAN